MDAPNVSDHRFDDALLELRRSLERVAPIPEPVWSELRNPWRLRSVNRGEHLTEENAVEDSFSFILDGVQRVYFTTGDGSEHTVAFAYTSDFSGIPDSFFLQKPSAYALEAITEGTILAISHDHLFGLMETHRELERWAWRLFASALSERARRERRLQTLTAEERYQRLLHESPQLIQLAPLKHIASYLGMSPETLSRIRRSIS